MAAAAVSKDLEGDARQAAEQANSLRPAKPRRGELCETGRAGHDLSWMLRMALWRRRRRVAGRLRSVLEAERPDLVYVPCFLEQHPDHYAASRILLEASRDSAVRSSASATRSGHRCFPTASSGSMRLLTLSERALAQYRSQLAQTDYMHSALGLNAYRSAAFKDNTADLPKHSVRFR